MVGLMIAMMFCIGLGLFDDDIFPALALLAQRQLKGSGGLGCGGWVPL